MNLFCVADESSVQFMNFVQSKTLINDDFEENLHFRSTEYFNKQNSTISNYERTYTFAMRDELKPEVNYLDLIELDENHYRLRRLNFKNTNQNSIKSKLLINSRLYLNEWTNGELEISIDKNLLDVGDYKMKIIFENDATYKVANNSKRTHKKVDKSNFDEFNEKVN